MTTTPDTPLADAPTRNWVDAYAPPAWRPFLRLARLDRPIGIWLLLWPCWWSLALAAPATSRPFPELKLLALFAFGAALMRAAGCTFNDIVDRDLDAKVARTASRPIASGAVTVRSAWIFLTLLSLAGLCVLLTFNLFAIELGGASLFLVAIYPFMKRITYWPQFILGLTFNWGALLGWAAATNKLELPAVLLYAGGVFWTLGYDTIYAHQDKEDDAVVGVRSSALKLGQATKPWLWVFYGAAIGFFATAGVSAGVGWPFFPLLAGAACHLSLQIAVLDIDDAESCLKVFRSNRSFGLIVFVAVAAGAWTGSP